MTKFVPHTPEEEITVKIKKREAILLQKLRNYPFGEFTVIKANGLILDIIINDRQRIEGDEKIELI